MNDNSQKGFGSGKGEKLAALSTLTFIGHPFASIGKGEELRASVRSALRLACDAKVMDIYKYAQRVDDDHVELCQNIEVDHAGEGMRLFHVNGDEVENTLKAFAARGGNFEDGYNVIVPAWELPNYPKVWVEQLEKFDEVWAISKFVQDSLAASGVKSTHIGQSVELPFRAYLSRKYFGIRDSAFTMLNFFDLSSYAARKNPDAVLAAFKKIRDSRPYDDIQLVLKVKNQDGSASQFIDDVRKEHPDVVFIDQALSSFEVQSLISVCDCFVSLHRSEGFGRGPGEAMWYGRLALATGWSGNLDYMTKTNSLLVDYELVPVLEGQYPHYEGESWAEADTDQAAHLLLSVIDDPARYRDLTSKGRHGVFEFASDRAVGTRMLKRQRQILSETEALA